MSFYSLARPLLFTLDPERAHALALSSLRLAHALHAIRARPFDPRAAIQLMGLRFPNRVGLAAGFDKNGRHIDALGTLGFGFLEIGTVTPRAQAGQPRPRLLRVTEARALINRMGFPNEGAATVAARLARRTFAGVCGVNIGKNAATPLDAALADYVECFRVLAPVADYVAVNVSSPNTQDLRRLQEIEQLRPIMAALIAERQRMAALHARPMPLLLKISPDLDEEGLAGIARLIVELRIDGVIATNTTLDRPGLGEDGLGEDGLGERWRREAGGLSGAPLHALALQTVVRLRALLGPAVPIVAAGGIESGRHALDAIRAGADLVQLYTGLIYRGPGLVREVATAL